MSERSVRPVRTKAELQAFIDLPWAVQGGDPCWVPPLKSEVRALLSEKHPFWRRARRELFLAWRDGRPVGRIAAIRDDAFIEFHKEQAGAFGFFECEKDARTAGALFDAAADWCRGQGLAFMRGPFNPSTNYEIGVLVEGFDRPPAVMMAHNPPWYPELMESCGLVKEKEVYAYLFVRGYKPQEWIAKAIERIEARGTVTMRFLDKKRMDEDIAKMCEVFEECWRENWGFVPLSPAEVQHMAKSLMPVLDEKLAFFLYFKGDLAGVALLLPDVNFLLKDLNGKLGIKGLYSFLFRQSKIPGARVTLFGMRPKYRRLGVPLVLFNYLMKIGDARQQYSYIEAGWTLEDNDDINNLLTEFGAFRNRRYRIYRRELTEG